MISRDLSNKISNFYIEISQVFGEFQHKSKLECPTGCGQCCFNPDICCSPYELLPLALYLLDNGLAESFLDKARMKKDEYCLMLEVEDEKSGKGKCGYYSNRPFICRAFAVSARHGKNGKIDYSVCRVLKKSDHYSPHFSIESEEVPFIEVWRKRLEILDPHLSEREIPINQALVIILEKVLVWNSYQ